jgi:YegS/Rv2252/BmrU family lipid kinase
MRIALIFNPTAGSSLLAQQHIPEGDFETVLLQTLRELDIDAEVYYTTLEDPGEGIARQLAQSHVRLVAAVGGDGTIHAVARGLLGSASVLGIIPAGTMNNLARSLGVPEKLQEACALLAHGEAQPVDVGRINQHVFLEVAGVGLEAALYPAAEAVKSSHAFGTFKGVIHGLRTLLSFRPPHISVAFDQEKPRTYRAIQLTACNAPYYGMHMNVAPGIFMNDGWLDAVLYTNFSKSEYLRHALSISQGKRPFAPKIIYRRAWSLRIDAATPIEIHADGVVVGTTPAEITVMPGALKVLVPPMPVPGLLNEKRKRRLSLPRFLRKGKIYA